jgi:DNA-directed RNA polymerase I subunit RPA49
MENSEPQSKKKRKSKRKIDTEPVHEPVIEPVKVKVEVVPMDPNKMAPFVGYFPSGFDPVNQPGSTDVQVYKHWHKHKRTELVVSPAGCSVEFVGTNYEGEAVAGHRSMYGLGVFDKEAKTLKVMQIEANKVNL